MRLAVVLVNEPPDRPADLLDRWASAGMAPVQRLGTGELDEVRCFLSDWLLVVDASPGLGRAGALNSLLARSTAAPHLTDHDTSGWHLHFRDDDLPLPEQLAALVSVGTALHLVARGLDRLGRCAAPDCQRVWADTSRGGRQKYCSPRCGNTEAVRRRRRR